MAVKRVKQKEHENLSDANVQRVIELLESDKPITKKVACEILNISYNTTRLSNIVDGYKHRKEIEKKNKAAKRGKPVTDDEIQSIIYEYLNGEAVGNIAKSIFRSTAFVTRVAESLGIPKKLTGEDRLKDAFLPDQCVSENFSPGEKVWSAQHHTACEVVREVVGDYEKKYGCKCYQIYVLEPVPEPIDGFPNVSMGGEFAYVLAYNLGSLAHLGKYISLGRV